MNAAMLKPKDCIIAISNSGRSREIINIVKVAQATGATVIAITASRSPLARLANYHLAADHSEHFEYYEPMVSRLIHLMIVDVLATCVAMSMGCKKLEPLLKNAKHSLCN